MFVSLCRQSNTCKRIYTNYKGVAGAVNFSIIVKLNRENKAITVPGNKFAEFIEMFYFGVQLN